MAGTGARRKVPLSPPVERLAEHIQRVEAWISTIPLADIATREDQFRFAAVYAELGRLRTRLTKGDPPAGWLTAINDPWTAGTPSA